MKIHGPSDIIITDLHMPEIDGWQLCWLLRSTICPAYNHIPILVVSATHFLKDAADIRTLGADDFLAAPFTPAQIRQRTRKLLEGSSGAAATHILVAGTADGSLTICKSFAKVGYPACHAPNCDIALQTISRQKIGLVIIHHSIAGDRGLELLDACRTTNPHLPVIVITSNTSEHGAVNLLRSGATGCVPEPLDLMELHELCRKTLRTRAIMAVETRIETQAQALKASECRYQTLFERMTDGFAHGQVSTGNNGSEPDFRFLDVNPAFARITGLDRAKLSGAYCGTIQDRQISSWKSLLAPTLLHGSQVHCSSYSPELGKHFEIQAFQPETDHIAITVCDISERVRHERETRERRERLKSIFRAAPIVIGVIKNDIITDINDAVLNLLGYRPTELIGKSSRVFFIENREHQRIVEETHQLLPKEHVNSLETTWHKKDGTCVEVLLSLSPICGAVHEQGIAFCATNITARKLTEKALRESEFRFRCLVESAPDAIFVETGGRFSFLNTAALQLFGADDRKQLLGEPLLNRHPTRSHEIIRERLRRINILREPMTRVEITFLRMDGTPVPAEASAVPINYKGEDGGLVFARDITERKQSEDTIAQSSWLLSSIREAQNLYIVGSDASQVFTSFLETLVEITGSAYGYICEVVGTGPATFLRGLAVSPGAATPENGHADRRQFNVREFHNLDSLMAAPFTTGTLIIDNHVSSAPQSNGAPGWHQTPQTFMGIPLFSGGNIVGVAGVANRQDGYSSSLAEFLDPFIVTCASVINAYQKDTERCTLLEQLHQTQKMEAIGQLAGGIAHDFNNILTAILGCSQMLHNKLPVASPLRNQVEMLLSSGEKAAALTQSLLAFSRKQTIHLQPLELNRTVMKIVKLLERLVGEDITIKVNLYPDALSINGDCTQIEQILLNLATNARDAMPEGGTIFISTEQRNHLNDTNTLATARQSPAYAAITFTDTGSGIPLELQNKIFEPFFTTKERGKGTGMGLAIVHGIIRQHNGHIELESSPERGTSFSILLPRIPQTPCTANERETTDPAGGSETILLAEDDQNARTLISLILREQGYQVLEAREGNEALSLFSAHKHHIDLALLDVIMPNKSGDALLREMLTLKPDQKILFMSGYTADRLNIANLDPDGTNFIAKPVTPAALLLKVRERLQAP